MRPAKAVCGRCLVRVDCALYAAVEPLPGVWGGMSEVERRNARPAVAKVLQGELGCASEEGCERLARAGGLCSAHYEKRRRQRRAA